ncbi:MAG: hypothetical protein IPL48_03945 [Bacteroidetes bacterium]|nr:hypothetical protein [Crocinitomicaceae bacterium]MBK8486924.1 hypothetical protein [Bacteroidota bacterium]
MAEKIIKAILAILFFICLADLPYGYYQFERLAAMVGFAFLSYQSYERNDKLFAFIFAALAILFQPLIKISLGREVWNVVDVVVGVALIITIFINRKNTSSL